MKLIKKGRRSGRTTELVQLAAANQYTIVCMDKRECLRILDIAKSFGTSIPKPYSFDELLRGRLKEVRTNGVVIDNVEYIIRIICLGHDVKGVNWGECNIGLLKKTGGIYGIDKTGNIGSQ